MIRGAELDSNSATEQKARRSIKAPYIPGFRGLGIPSEIPMDSVNLGSDQPLPMRNTLEPQTGHTPCVAGRLFFITMDLGFLISLWALHFIQ